MRGFSKAIITGNLTRDPELRTTTNGRSICRFSVAVNRVYRDANNDQKEEVAYIDCAAWGALGEMINKYARKGSGVLVSGRLRQDNWEDKTTGQKRSRLEVVVEDFNFVGGGRDNGNSDSYNSNSSSAESSTSSDPSESASENVLEEIPEGDISLDEVPF